MPDPGTKLAWAKTESFAFVVYYKQGTSAVARKQVGVWTREMIDQVLSVGGTYYLPYQPLATDDQFHRAYPHATEYFSIKKHYDPTDKFTNTLWDTYYNPEKLAYYKEKESERVVASTTAEYYRPYDNAYLSLPEWRIVYSADEYAATLRDSLPSHFPYSLSNQEYWRQYNQVQLLTKDSGHNNTDYETVLSVIGWSYSIENIVKGLYEHTIGRVSEWAAGDTQVPEDQYAATTAKEYADFIYDYPWYDFPFGTHLKNVWAVHATHTYTWGQDARRIERKMFLSVEYGAKALYSTAIRAATHAKFGVQDDVVYAIVTHNRGVTHELIQAPHYQPFTRLLLNEFAKEGSSTLFKVVDISGNDTITFTYKDTLGAKIPEGAKEIMRNREIHNVVLGASVYLDRITVEANVSDLFLMYQNLLARGVTIDHFYDY